MVRLRRRGVKAPANWQTKVDAALPNAAEFWRKAARFERLDEQSPTRVKGFVRWAPHVLPKPKGKKAPEFPAVWRDGQVKRAISKMSNGYCAYCQTSVSANHPGKVPGQVEHFKPKSRFPTLAYDVNNYFLVCGACNLKKHDQWPRGGYVRPDRADPAKRFVFDEDGSIRAARSRDVQAQQTIDDFGLQRRGLKKLRRVMIKAQLRTLRLTLQLPRVRLTKRQLDRWLVKPFSPLSEAVNQNVQRVCAEWRKKRRPC
ncbi:MAG TPA: HNH endonuclease [Polyangiaceae bacterium]|nr:HNH endonuclease [Polyangiaceae bacterium]